MQLIDTHAHLNDERYDDLDEVLLRAKEAGLTRIILASASYEDCLDSIQLASSYNTPELALWCTVGVHPHDAEKYTDEIHQALEQWLGQREKHRIVALGEIGLDYHYDNSPRDVQKQVFSRQLELAFSADIPIVLHEREAAMDCLDILDSFAKAGKLRSIPGVCHCFSGSSEVAQKLISYGFYLGFDGPITFKNNRKAPEVIQAVPLERLLVETDCPYLTPVPFRGQRNEPAYVQYVLNKMAELRGLSPEAMAGVIMENASRVFGLYQLMDN